MQCELLTSLKVTFCQMCDRFERSALHDVDPEVCDTTKPRTVLTI